MPTKKDLGWRGRLKKKKSSLLMCGKGGELFSQNLRKEALPKKGGKNRLVGRKGEVYREAKEEKLRLRGAKGEDTEPLRKGRQAP